MARNKLPMLSRIITLLSVIIIEPISLIQSSIIPPPPPFNLSHFIYPKVTAFTESNTPPHPPYFLQGVLDAIANKEKLGMDYIRVLELDVKKAKPRIKQKARDQWACARCCTPGVLDAIANKEKLGMDYIRVLELDVKKAKPRIKQKARDQWACAGCCPPGVLDAIANKEKLGLDHIRVLELDVKKAKYSTVQRYEFRVRVGKTEVVLKMHDEVSEWKKLVELGNNESSDFEALVRRIGAKAVIDSFKIEGPFELRVARDDDQLSLALPLNTSYSGLRRISVGEGITVEVKGAEEISIFNPSDRHHHPYTDKSIWPALCTSLLPIRILGSASVFAYRNKRPSAHINTVFSSKNAIKLLPDKCYVRPEKPKHIFNSLSIRISMLERVLRNLLNETGNQNSALGSLKERIKASTLFRFQLGLEKDIRSNDTYWSTLADWRTRPIIERVFFEVVARMEGEVMKPLIIKKVRPFLDSDSFAWNSLLSNLSFTKFPSVLVPPEALTLDVKW
ncbi:hypothetical protein BUALT_Bualt01G0036300 [Buddleja alternifolia]|uniref:Uncharacterized protein n=1 Tax=Buddleja alternifolia TaxID=168488 RepID=A0AAV6YF51_9LAMI|nr:hypothetical protein BUALT_Bualt01G0036300 [Buddleja alternifolia]